MGEPLPPVRFVSLSQEHNCSGFTCANREITDWVRKRAMTDHAPGVMHVTCALPEDEARPIGIYAISTVAEEVRNLPGRRYLQFRGGKHFPALHLVWLATDRYFEGRGLGKLMMGEVIREFAGIGDRAGIPHLVLTPADQDKEKLEAFYSRLGFEPYKDGESMYLSIEKALDAFNPA